MMNRTSVRFLSLVAAIGFAACGETSDLVMGELSEAEAADMAGAVMFATFNSSDDVPEPASGASGPQTAPFAFSTEVAGDVPCPMGGVVGVVGSLEVHGNTESQAGSLEYAVTQVHDGCMVMSENERLFTLWGNPSLSAAFAVENNGQGVVEWGGSVQGSVDWVTDGREGSCSVAVEFSGRQEGEASVSGDFEGTVCGFTLSRSFSIG
jgi:hypothetical protein